MVARKQPRAALALTTALAAASAGALSCRAIAGIKHITFAAVADAEADTAPPVDAPAESGDGGADACGPAGTQLFNTPDTLSQIAIENGAVFVGTGLGVLSCGIGGCASSPSTIASAPTMTGLTWGEFAVSPGLIYYSLTGSPSGGPDGGPASGQIRTVELDGTNDSPFTSGPYPTFVTLAAGYLFWVNDPSAGTGASDAGPTAIFQCALNTQCNTTPWATGIGRTYATFADATNLYVLAQDPTSASMTSTLFSCPLPTTPNSASCGSTPHSVLTNVDTTSGMPFAFASDGTYIYGTDAAFPQIVRVPIQGGTPSVYVKTTDPPQAMTFDSTDLHLYWVSEGGDVLRVAADGSPAEPVACGAFGANLIATDTTSIYLAEAGADTAVLKIAKP